MNLFTEALRNHLPESLLFLCSLYNKERASVCGVRECYVCSVLPNSRDWKLKSHANSIGTRTLMGEIRSWGLRVLSVPMPSTQGFLVVSSTVWIHSCYADFSNKTNHHQGPSYIRAEGVRSIGN